LLSLVQAGREEQLVERAVARYAAEQFRGKALGLELPPREFGTPHPPTGPPQASYRTPEHWAAVAQDAGARPGRSQSGKFCRNAAETDCVWAIIRIGVPAITGDSALVWLYEFEAIEHDAMEETDIQLLLVRTNGAWQVTERLEMRSAYYVKPNGGASAPME
jgi:hypothetical protein